MQDLAFPIEIAGFKDRIDPNWQEKISSSLSESDQKADLPLWYQQIRKLLTQETTAPNVIWGLAAKLAWILTDIQFFVEHAERLQKQYQNNSQLLFWLAAGIAEFLDIQTGLELLKLAYDGIVSLKDWQALLDVAAVYGCITLNCDAKSQFQESYHTIKRVFEEELHSNQTYLPLFIPVQLFAMQAGLDSTEIDSETLMQQVKRSNNRLFTAWTYNMLAKKQDQEETTRYMMASIAELQKIHAIFRLIMAHTSLARFLFEKGKQKEATRNLSTAFSLIEETSQNHPAAGGLFLYTMTTSAWMSLELGKIQEAQLILEDAQKKADTYQSSQYQVKIGFGLAYTSFLSLQHERAEEYIQRVLEGIELFDAEHQTKIHFKCIDILLDLQRFESAKEILDRIDVDQLKKCAIPTYYYIRGKFEFSRYNVGIGKEFLIKAMQNENTKDCKELRSVLKFQTAECYLHEYKLSEDKNVLVKAQELIEEGLKNIPDVPTKIKGLCLSAILLTTQERYEEAEEILEQITTSSEFVIPMFQEMAESIWDSIRDARAGMASSPISHFKDMVRYLREAKTMIDTQPR